MQCQQCNYHLTRTAVGLMCLSCGYISHDQPSERVQTGTTQGTVTIEQTLPAGTNIDGLLAAVKSSANHRALGVAKRMIQPQINPDAVIVLSETTQKSTAQAKSSQRALVRDITPNDKRSSPRRPIGIIVTGFAVVALVGVFVVTSLHLNHQLSSHSSGVTGVGIQTALISPKSDAAIQQRDAVRKKDLTEIATALQVYHAQIGSYPVGSTFETLFTLLSSNPSYLNQLNHDPSNEKDAKRDYQYSSNGKNYILRAHLENTNDASANHGNFEIKN